MTDREGHSQPGNNEFFDRAIDRIREAGRRLTPQRNAILELFDRRDAHMTPQKVYDALEGELSSLSLATVYNTLEIFEELGVVDKICSDDGQTYFDPNTEPHQHAVCQKCGEIFDLDVSSSKLDGLVESLQQSNVDGMCFDINSVNIWLKGLCSNCQ